MTKAELLKENQRLSNELILLRDLNKMFDDSSNKAWKKCGALDYNIQVLKYRLEMARVEFYKLTGKYDQTWPEMSSNDLIKVSRGELPNISQVHYELPFKNTIQKDFESYLKTIKL